MLFIERLSKYEILEFLNSVNIKVKKIAVNPKLNNCFGIIGMNLTYFISSNQKRYAQFDDFSFFAITEKINLSEKWQDFMYKKFGNVYLKVSQKQSERVD